MGKKKIERERESEGRRERECNIVREIGKKKIERERDRERDRPDDPSHHERTLIPRSYISLLLVVSDRFTPTQ